jgi:hypothetical protein
MTTSSFPEATARTAIRAVNPSLETQFLHVVRLLNASSSLRPTPRGKSAASLTVPEYLSLLANQFASARSPRAPQKPQTIPDSVVGTILNGFYGIEPASLPTIAETHLLSMAAENVVGELLERYIAQVLEPHGWVWCSGSVVRSVDFIFPSSSSAPPFLLQIKNRDNSENSSSSAIRDGTSIEKWFRSFSKKPATNWGAFPNDAARGLLSESGFNTFVRNYMHSLRPRK